MNLSNSESNLAKIEFCSISKSCFAFGMEIKSQVSQLSQKVLTAKLSIISSSSAKKQSAGVLGGPASNLKFYFIERRTYPSGAWTSNL